MNAEIIDGLSVLQGSKHKLKVRADELVTENVRPCLSTILVGENPASVSYINRKQKVASDVGIITRDLRFNSTVKQEELAKAISDLNADNDVHGVLVQLPLPAQIDQNDMIKAKPTSLKDVDGLTPFNAGMLLKGNPPNNAVLLPVFWNC